MRAKIFGLEFSVEKATPQPTQPMYGDRGNWWWPVIREPYTGAWQRNIELRAESIVTYFAVYACVSLISTDVGKLRLRLMQQDDAGLWREATSPSFSPVLRKPNHYQTRGKFIEQWIISKLLHGNTYILKERDDRNVVVRLYILDPLRTKPVVAPDGSVFYEVNADNLSGLRLPVRVPASEIIHDIMVPLFHPLCGVSPMLAAALPATQGLTIQKESATFFSKGARPGGVLTAPGKISQDTADRLKEEWNTRFTGANAGDIAVLGDGLKYEAMAVPAEDAQLIEQLKWTAENVAAVFHVPPHMLGIGAAPAYNNVEALNQQYYSQCLQTLIEAIESLLDDGLGLTEVKTATYGTEFDLDDLLRMDTATNVESTAASVKAGILSPNEARRRFNLPPTEGGESPYLQQQNFSLADLARRTELGIDAAAAPAAPAEPATAGNDAEADNEDPVDAERILTLAGY